MDMAEIIESAKGAVNKAIKYDKLEIQFKSVTNKSALEVLEIVKQYGLPSEVDNLEYNRKVKVPKFVAERILRYKKHESNIWFCLKDSTSSELSKWLWEDNNADTLAQAWVNGYEVEEETWEVRLRFNDKEEAESYAHIECGEVVKIESC